MLESVEFVRGALFVLAVALVTNGLLHCFAFAKRTFDRIAELERVVNIHKDTIRGFYDTLDDLRKFYDTVDAIRIAVEQERAAHPEGEPAHDQELADWDSQLVKSKIRG